MTTYRAGLAAAERTLERLDITRETMPELPAEDGIEPPEPLPPGYREVLAALEQAGHGPRAKEVCEMLGVGTEPRHTESIRAQLKRLVDRDILTEPEPEAGTGLFTLPQPASVHPRARAPRRRSAAATGPSPTCFRTSVPRCGAPRKTRPSSALHACA
ncbi:hypothetical protein [Streptomyces sp. NPDC058371]|uniref:hypothetical protein n=1 Tax=Streptomyces sp. NPDC058371 TaxID=3346463 RepID=UPI00366302F4